MLVNPDRAYYTDVTRVLSRLLGNVRLCQVKQITDNDETRARNTIRLLCREGYARSRAGWIHICPAPLFR